MCANACRTQVVVLLNGKPVTDYTFQAGVFKTTCAPPSTAFILTSALHAAARAKEQALPHVHLQCLLLCQSLANSQQV